MKLKSYIFLIVLVVVLVFIVGVRYGQSIEKSNKTVEKLLSVTPTQTPAPTPTITYADYKSKKWGITFTYPSNLEVKENASKSAVLFKYGKN